MTIQNRKRTEATEIVNLDSKPVISNVGQSFRDFVQSLGDVLIDITALEVNTMIVEQITGEKFIAWEAYRDIYSVSTAYLEQEKVHQSLCDQYMGLRKNLELEYTLMLSDPTSEFYDPNVLNAVSNDNQILTDSTVEMGEIQTRLPDPIRPTNPEEILRAKKLLNNCHFLRSLRKMSELKAALDHRNKALHKKQSEQPEFVPTEVIQKAVKTDIIYAQTIVQLDGDVINRYSQEIFDHPHREMILQLHREGVTSGERQWRGLLQFIINLVQASLNSRSFQGILPWNSSDK
ncbi:hypothetical protein [Lyngbya aestuarii]|uniref:hypothetical protein n=1 Tax=Lyngbya aestuarii TaxID=118322 RepID=UPI00403DBA2E